MTKHKDEIFRLHNEGKTRKQIKEATGCSDSTLYFHLSEGAKAKIKIARTKRRNTQHPFVSKTSHFKNLKYKKTTRNQLTQNARLLELKIQKFHEDRKTKMKETITFTSKDVIEKFGETVKCYLTGESIDIYQPRTYHFDHIIPVSKGGTNTIDNLGICTKRANLAKGDMTPEELYEFCKMVIKHKESSLWDSPAGSGNIKT